MATDQRRRRHRRQDPATMVTPRPVYNEQTFQEGFQPVVRRRQRIPMPTETPMEDIRNSCRQTSVKAVLRNKVRVFNWLPRYFRSGAWRKKLPLDMAAGLTVGVMNIPQGLAYAQLANIDPIYGLYTSFIPAIIYLIFGSSRHIAVGTFAVVSLMVGEVVSSLQAAGSSTMDLSGNYSQNTSADGFCGPAVSGVTGCVDAVASNGSDVTTVSASPTGIEVAVTVTILVGLLQIAMSVFRLGIVTMFLSEALVSGYTTGAACHVFTSQVRSIFGIKMATQENPGAIFKTFIYIFSHIKCTNGGALLTGLISGATLYILKRLNPIIQKKIKFPLPAELLIIIVVTFISWQVDFHERFKIDIVNCIPTGPPPAQFSSFSRLPWKDAIGPSVSIAVVAFAIAVSVGQGFAKKHAYTVDPNQELLALGLCNVVGGSFSCIVSTASLSRSAVYEAVGATTQFGSLFGVGIIVFVIFLIGHLFEPLPKAVLAAIIMVSLKGLFLQFRELRRLWKISIADASVWFVTWLGTVVFGVDLGLAIGIGYSLVIVIFRTSRPYYCMLGQARGTDIYRDSKVYSDIVDVPAVRIFRFEASLYFANIQYFLECLHHSVDLDPATEKRRLKRGASSHSNTVTSPLPGRSDRDVEASPQDFSHSRLAEVDCSDSDDDQMGTSTTLAREAGPPVLPAIRYRKAVSQEDGVVSEQEDTVHVVVLSADVDGSQPSPPPARTPAKGASTIAASTAASAPPAAPVAVAQGILLNAETERLIISSDEDEDRPTEYNPTLNDAEAITQVTETRSSNSRMASTTSAPSSHGAVVPVRYVVLDCSPVNYMDTQAVSVLTALATDYEAIGVELLLANCRYRVRQMLDDGGFLEKIGSDRLFVSVHDAVRHCQSVLTQPTSPLLTQEESPCEASVSQSPTPGPCVSSSV